MTKLTGRSLERDTESPLPCVYQGKKLQTSSNSLIETLNFLVVKERNTVKRRLLKIALSGLTKKRELTLEAFVVVLSRGTGALFSLPLDEKEEEELMLLVKTLGIPKVNQLLDELSYSVVRCYVETRKIWRE